jgi:hypothetical protein
MATIQRKKNIAITTRLIKSGHICRYNGDFLRSASEVRAEVERLCAAHYKMKPDAAMKTIEVFATLRSAEYERGY